MNAVPRPEGTRTPVRISRFSAVTAVLVTLVVGAGLAVFLTTRPDRPAGPGVAKLGPTTPTGSPTLPGDASHQATGIAFSACMRAHGLPDFPDPDSNGSIKLVYRAGTASDLDPNSPLFQGAQTACAKLSSKGNITPAQRAQARSANLRVAACMRGHGLPDFPDPTSQGGFDIVVNPGSDLDSGSPRCQAAQNACQSLRIGD